MQLGWEREGATTKHQQRTSRRPAAVDAAQQLLRDGQSRAYGQRGKMIKSEVEQTRKVEKVRREKEDRKNEKR